MTMQTTSENSKTYKPKVHGTGRTQIPIDEYTEIDDYIFIGIIFMILVTAIF